MATKLNEITTQYHTFVENQVLTHTQLNEFISYFEDQDRLSRILLSGVGIVCGFRLFYDPESKTVTISAGSGITTDGDLLTLRNSISESPRKTIVSDSISYNWFRKFDDHIAHYRFFSRLQDVEDSATAMPLKMWELLPGEAENAKTLDNMENPESMVVLLYLESYPLEGDLCTAKDCDNQGVEEVNRLRVLMVSKEDAAFIAGLDPVFTKHDIAETVISLPEVEIRRVILNGANTSTYTELKRAYHTALNSDNLIENLSIGISRIVNHFGSLLHLEISSAQLNSVLTRLRQLTGFGPYNVPFNVQYRYDMVLDVVDTYNEIKAELLHLKQECIPDITSFPKHLLLGQLDEVEQLPKHYRHAFYKSPALNEHDRIHFVQSLVYRLFEMIRQFSTSTGEVKITPSVMSHPLNRKAIPFYYNVNHSLLNVWDHAKTIRFKQKNNLSYHTGLLSSAPKYQDPLRFDLGLTDFFRIEGHQGKNYIDVLDEIDTLKQRYGLAFDVKALSVNVNTDILNIDEYECEFEDLNVLLKAWTAEQDCILAEVSEFLSGFRTDKPGRNYREEKYKAVDLVLRDNNRTFNEEADIRAFTNRMKSGMMINTNGNYTAYAIEKSNTINDNLVTEDNAIGSDLKVVFESNKGGSANDFIMNAHRLIDAKVNTEEWKNAPEIKDLVIDQSIEIMAFAHILATRMPDLLINVNTERVDIYQLTLKQLCRRVEIMKEKYQTVQLTDALKAVMGVLINQLSTICCSGKKLQILLREITSRKEQILLRLQFARFVEQHPGVEHKAGVKPGGTFIILYINKQQDQVKDKSGTVSLMGNAGKDYNINRILDPAKGRDTGNGGYYSDIRHAGSNKTEEELIRNILNKDVRVTDLANNTVVADFTLPYMCCSDCAPVNFIVQRQPVSLRIEKDQFCLGQDKSPLLFDVSPADGIIKADPEVNGLSVEENKLIVDAESFDEAYIGKPIRFTVNEQVTDVIFTVYKSVDFDFTVKHSEKDNSVVTFIPDGDLVGASFLWNFGDGSTDDERAPGHQYTLPVNEENKVTVSLTVTAANGVCHATVEHELTFKIPDPVLHIEPDIFCANDNQQYPFTVDPEGTAVVIEGKGVVKNSTGMFSFVPKNAGSGTFTFKINGKDSGVSVKVNEAPKASFTHAQVENTLVLTNTSTGAQAYKWNVNGKTVEQLSKKNLTVPVSPNISTIRVSLEAVSETCGSDKTKTVSIETKFTETDTDTCISDTIEVIQTDQKAVEKLDVPGNAALHSIWQETTKLYDEVSANGSDFLTGKSNAKLHGRFSKLFNATVKQITALSINDSVVNQNKIKELFRLQLELFYNILGCQKPDVIKASTDDLQPVLDIILELLSSLKNKKILLPKSLNVFMKAYSVKIKAIQLLQEHMTFISKNKLIIFA
ncbi:PKD domain-containing protein [Saccharicrinis sp. FJH54]|uniref:PKD domain-containing protein n=1 Tax=Saccharicrinis sp. FJH54 TaxID=3344665 RepID=UPI0035D4660E